MDAHKCAGIWYNASAARRCFVRCAEFGNYGLSEPSQEGFSTLGHVRALPVSRLSSSEDSVPVEDGAVGLLLELSAEEDGVEDDALGVDAADP